MTSILLVAYAAVCAIWAPGRLVKGSWVLRAPRLGLTVWLTLGYTALASVILAGILSVVLWRDTHHLLRSAWQVCVDALGGAHGPAARVGALAGLVLLVGVAARLAIGTWPVAVIGKRRLLRHADVLDLVGYRSVAADVTVLPNPAASAYVLPGRRPRVVITTGALQALDGEQTAAVLAHERAHAVGRHHRLVLAARLLAGAFSKVSGLRVLEGQVVRLVEICADDVAARAHRRLALAHALVTMAEIGEQRPMSWTPAGSLGLVESDVAERLHRLLEPPVPLSQFQRTAICAATAALPLVPLVLMLIPGLRP